MPSGWTLDRIIQSINDNEGQGSGASAGFSAESPPYYARALESLYRYDSSGKVARHYDRFEQTYFNDDSIYRTTPWDVPVGFSFSSSTATKWRFGCAGSNFNIGPQDGTTSTICNYLAQYDEFLVFFTVTIQIDDQSFLTTSELVSLVEAIDQKISDYLHPTPVLP
jgi:hypothetical protein